MTIVNDRRKTVEIKTHHPTSSPPLPNRPPKPPKSRRKNLPILLRFSFRLFAVLSDEVCACEGCCAVVGAGDVVPDVPAAVETVAPVPVAPVPKRSTPSLAAEMMAEPSMVASKREGMDAAAVLRPCETEPEVAGAGPCRAARMGLLCCRLVA